MKERKHFRTFDQICYGEAWPFQGPTPDAEESQRHRGIAEVLSSIPEEDYENLIKAFENGYEWFIPHESSDALVYPFHATIYPPEQGENKLTPAPYVPVIYLSPMLEKAPWVITLATVAHELAHVALAHKLNPPPDEYDAQEEAAFKQMCGWGFVEEEKSLRDLNREKDAFLGNIDIGRDPSLGERR